MIYMNDGIFIDSGTARMMKSTIENWKKQNNWMCNHSVRGTASLPRMSGNFYDAVLKDFERLINNAEGQNIEKDVN